MDRDSIIRRLIGWGIVLVLVGTIAAVFVPVDRSPAPVRQTVTATTAPVMTAMPVRTAAPAQIPVTAPGLNSLQSPAQPVTRLDTIEDAAELAGWMIETNTLNVALDGMTLSSEALEEAMSLWPEIDRYGWDVEHLELELRTGAQIIAAVKNGDESSLNSEQAAILQRARGVVSSLISPGMSDLEKEIKLHDYIIYNCDYEINESLHTEDARGFFNHGRAQCCGYSDVFQMLGYLSGLEIRLVSGEVIDGNGGHEWNLIRLDGLWYGVDVTWDDPTGGGEENGTYLNFPHHMMDSVRTFDRRQLPEGAYAQQLDRNFYPARCGLTVSTAAEAKQMLLGQMESGSALQIYSISGEMAVNDIVKEIFRERNQGASWNSSILEGPGPVMYYKITID